jgi:hypothetical protein
MAESPDPAVKVAHAKVAGAAPSLMPREALDLLAGGGRLNAEDGGYVVVARAPGLQSLQALCHSKEADGQFLTVRYRLRSGPVFANLLAAFDDDLVALRSGGRELRGAFRPDPRDAAQWGELAKAWNFSSPRLSMRWLRALLQALNKWDAKPSRRVLLLCEVEGTPGEPDEWHKAIAALGSAGLPNGVGLVFSSAPPGWQPEVDGVPSYEFSFDAAGADPQDGRGFTYIEAALSGDQPAEVDRLGATRLADGLAKLLRHQDTRPLTVGVQAPWGRGKSSFMSFVRNALIIGARKNQDAPELVELRDIEARMIADDPPPGPPGADASTHAAEAARELERDRETRRKLMKRLERNAESEVICVTFNAWRFEGAEQVWAGLARETSERLEAALPLYGRAWSRILYATRKRRLEFSIGFVLPAVLALIVGVVAVVAGIQTTVPSWGTVLGTVGVAILTPLIIGWRFFRVAQPVSSRVAGYLKAPDYGARMGFQNEVIDDLTFLRRQVSARRGNGEAGSPRVVVFVDDLDRCSDDNVMGTLQAVNLILGGSDFFVVLGIDAGMIHRAIARQYQLSDDSDLVDAFAENYLRKIIQLPLNLPQSSADQRFVFISRLFSLRTRQAYAAVMAPPGGTNGASPAATTDADEPIAGWVVDPLAVVESLTGVSDQVEDTKDELETIHAFSRFLQPEPRELKRLINVHRLAKILSANQAPTPAQQRKLVTWLVFCARWPDLADDVLASAISHPGETDCIATVLNGDRESELGAFVKAAATVPLSAADFRDEGFLAEASRISILVRDRAATKTKSKDEPVKAS